MKVLLQCNLHINDVIAFTTASKARLNSMGVNNEKLRFKFDYTHEIKDLLEAAMNKLRAALIETKRNGHGIPTTPNLYTDKASFIMHVKHGTPVPVVATIVTDLIGNQLGLVKVPGGSSTESGDLYDRYWLCFNGPQYKCMQHWLNTLNFDKYNTEANTCNTLNTLIPPPECNWVTNKTWREPTLLDALMKHSKLTGDYTAISEILKEAVKDETVWFESTPYQETVIDLISILKVGYNKEFYLVKEAYEVMTKSEDLYENLSSILVDNLKHEKPLTAEIQIKGEEDAY